MSKVLRKAVLSVVLAAPSLALNQPLTSYSNPTAVAGADQTVEWQAWVGLDGRQSTTPDMGALTYVWTQVSGPTTNLFDANTETCYFRADDPAFPATYEFQLQVTNSLGLQDTDVVRIDVEAVDLGFTGDPDVLTPYAPVGGLTQREAQHLARRIAFDMSPAEIAALRSVGLDASVTYVTTQATTLPQVTTDALAHLSGLCDHPQYGKFYDVGQAAAQNYLLHYLIHDRQNVLRSKLTYFFHDLFATSTKSLVTANDHFRVRHADLILDHALGTDHEAFLNALFKDRAMQVWLNIKGSLPGAPNENFMRELMELFTIGLEEYVQGIPNYDELDVQQGSRVLTGWDLLFVTGCSPGVVVPVHDPNNHDAGPVSLFGGPANITDEADVIAACLAHPAASRFIAKRLFFFLCGFEPSGTVLTDLAAEIVTNGWNLIPTIARIAKSEAMFSLEARKSKYANPMEICLGLMRKFDMPINIGMTRTRLNAMGHGVLQPPSVKGWPEDDSWISQQGQVDLMEFVHQVVFIARSDANLATKLAPFMPSDPNLRDGASFLQSLFRHMDIDNEELTPAVFTRLMDYMNKFPASGAPSRFDSSIHGHIKHRATGAIYHGYTLSIGIHN